MAAKMLKNETREGFHYNILLCCAVQPAEILENDMNDIEEGGLDEDFDQPLFRLQSKKLVTEKMEERELLSRSTFQVVCTIKK